MMHHDFAIKFAVALSKVFLTGKLYSIIPLAKTTSPFYKYWKNYSTGAIMHYSTYVAYNTLFMKRQF